MPIQIVALPGGVQIVPKSGGPLLRPQRRPDGREDGRSPLRHIAHVEEDSRDSVASAQVLKGPRLLFLDACRDGKINVMAIPSPPPHPPLLFTHPGEIKVRFIVSPNAVVNHLQLLGRAHGETSHILDTLRDGLHVVMLVVLQPCTFADAVVGRLQFARLVILHGGTTELHRVPLGQ